MSSFFTLLASQKKRKRDDAGTKDVSKKTKKDSFVGKSQQPKPSRSKPDESISGSESDSEGEKRASNAEISESSSDSGGEEATGAERRLRLAERYLENIRGEVEVEHGFDAAEIDRDRIAERLKEDVAETKGRLYRHIADHFVFTEATITSFRSHAASLTSIAVCSPYVYTTSADSILTKWELAPPPSPLCIPKRKRSKPQDKPVQAPPPHRRRPSKLLSIKPPSSTSAKDSKVSSHHTSSILSVAASSDGHFVVTGGNDRRLIVWSAETLQPLKTFTQHRDSVTSLAFRRGTNQLYSASKDRTVKTWSLNELAYVETLFGHQDGVVDVAALAQERCLTAGARDRTARLWKVVDETQLVFLGGGGGGDRKSHKANGTSNGNQSYSVGSLDRVAFIDEDTFVTGSDNGSLMLWNVQKKKPVFTCHLAHGLQPIENLEDISAEQSPEDVENIPRTPQPRWITALATIPYSDIIVSGSWDGWVRAWRVSNDKRKIEALGPVGKVEASIQLNGYSAGNNARREIPRANGMEDGVIDGVEDGDYDDIQVAGKARGRIGSIQCVNGVINDLKVFERGDKGKESLCIVAAIGKEHRLGRWMQVDGRNGAVVLDVPRRGAGRKRRKKKNKGKAGMNAKEEALIANGVGKKDG